MSITLTSLCLVLAPQGSASLPAGFQIEAVDLDLEQATDIAFWHDGTALFAEKAGRLLEWEPGHAHAHVLVDFSEEVANTSGRGFTSMALDPDFQNNGFVYVLFSVDRHHLFEFGTPSYDPTIDEHEGPTINRVARYTIQESMGGLSINPASRTVLIGDTAGDGIPAIHLNHDCCCLRFGEDGSLLVSTGDVALDAYPEVDPDSLQAVADGIVPGTELLGPARSQSLNNLAGKLLRVDPATGDGLPSNPFFIPLDARAPQSRIYSYGLRNPFRFAVIPGSGTPANPPGTILLSDVGESLKEEINAAVRPGMNFGWPIFEGLGMKELGGESFDNLLAPNPRFGLTDQHGTVCDQEYFTFGDLIVQESLNPPSFVNPCDAAYDIPASYHPSVHSRPLFDWGHLSSARAGAFDGFGEATEIEVDDSGSPITSEQFTGSAAIAGTWYTGTSFPLEYQNRFYFADYTGGWIRWMTLAPDMATPVAMGSFASGVANCVCIAASPTTGDLYFLEFDGDVYRITYDPNNQPPNAVALRDKRFGPAPHTIRFDGRASSDAEGSELRYLWDFGDGTPPSRLASPRHTFPSEDVTDHGTFIAKVLELTPPPNPSFTGLDPAVVHDGVFADLASSSLYPVFLTFAPAAHNPDPAQWIGYEFSEERRFHTLVFQEGPETYIGGYFLGGIHVQVRRDGIWRDVRNLVCEPPYLGSNGIENEIFELHFDGAKGDAIRLWGYAGGTLNIISVCELRAIADPLVDTPTRYDVELSVIDEANLVGVDVTPVWINNTPPTVQVISPVLGDHYDPTVPSVVDLDALVSDLESPTSALTSSWRAFLHHNDHTHPEPVINGTTGQLTLNPHGNGGTDRFAWSFEFTVEDELGLETKAKVELFDEPATLYADAYELSVSAGGTVDFTIDAGPQFANYPYALLMSSSGTWPGFDVQGVTVPLNVDLMTFFALTNPSIFAGGLSSLDAQGRATVVFSLPPLTFFDVIGSDVQLSAVATLTPMTVEFVSNPLRFRVVE